VLLVDSGTYEASVDRPRTACPKVLAERYLAFYRSTYGIDCRVARISNAFGVGQDRNKGAASTFMYKALVGEPITIWGDGKRGARLHLRGRSGDGLLALAAAPFHGDESLPTFNIASGQGLSLKASWPRSKRISDDP